MLSLCGLHWEEYDREAGNVFHRPQSLKTPPMLNLLGLKGLKERPSLAWALHLPFSTEKFLGPVLWKGGDLDVPFEGVSAVRVLQEGMRVAVLNQNLLANNIANVDTPNYNPVRLDFQATLRDALDGNGRVSLRKTLPQHLEAERWQPQFKRVALTSKNDYNKVDLEQEMADLAENTGRYTTYGSLLAKQFKMVKDMLTGVR